MAPRGAKLEPQGLPKYRKDTKMYPKVPKCRRRCHNEAPGHPQRQKDTKVVPCLRLFQASGYDALLRGHVQPSSSTAGRTPKAKQY